MQDVTSRKIKALRFILIVLVVFIHNNSRTFTNTIVSDVIKTAFSETIARAAVPLFFLIAGYLLFYKQRKYAEVLKKKAVTLLLPYMIWNSLELLMFFVGQNVPFLSAMFTNENNMVSQYRLNDWLTAFVGTGSGYPIAYQFWFIRDLMIIIICYPIGKWLIDHVPLVTISILSVLWLTDCNIGIVSAESILFFFLGYYLIRFKVDFKILEQINYLDMGICYIGCIILRVYSFMIGDNSNLIYKFSIILGSFFFLKVAELFIQNELIYTKLADLSGYAFFVYAFHEPFLTLLRKVADRVWIPVGTIAQMVQYFGLVIGTISAALVVGWCLKKICPKCYAIMTGGRA